MNIRRIVFTILCWCLTLQPAVQAQESTAKSIGDILLDDVLIALDDGGSFVTAPLRFDTRDWVVTAGLAGATGALIAADADLKLRWGRATQQSLNHDLWDIPTRYGIVEYANIVAVSTYALGLLGGNDGIRVTGRLLFESLAFAGGSVMVVRYIAGRSRPYGDNTPWDFNGFRWSNEFQSFPSGHTVVAFAMSTVLAERIDQLWARVFFYGMASLTAFARVHNNQHWVSDVFAGAVFGIAAGCHVVGREEARDGTGHSSRITLIPFLAGIRLEYGM